MRKVKWKEDSPQRMRLYREALPGDFTLGGIRRLYPSSPEYFELNAYGLVVSDDKDELPLNCGHGGSGWLCRSCAETFVRN